MVYYYEGVANLTEEEGAHEKAFYDALLPIMENQHESGKLFFKEKYDKIVYVLKSVDEGKEAKQLKEEGYTQASAWVRKYGIFSFGSSDVVVEKEDGVDIDVDHLKRPSYYERVFSDLKEIHHPDHPKGESFSATGLVQNTATSRERSANYLPTHVDDATNKQNGRSQLQV